MAYECVCACVRGVGGVGLGDDDEDGAVEEPAEDVVGEEGERDARRLVGRVGECGMVDGGAGEGDAAEGRGGEEVGVHCGGHLGRETGVGGGACVGFECVVIHAGLRTVEEGADFERVGFQD